jgi:hypothetical protein
MTADVPQTSLSVPVPVRNARRRDLRGVGGSNIVRLLLAARIGDVMLEGLSVGNRRGLEGLPVRRIEGAVGRAEIAEKAPDMGLAEHVGWARPGFERTRAGSEASK